jgi:hypothetical protein
MMNDMHTENRRGNESIIYPRFGDIVRLLPGQRTHPEDEEWVITGVDEGTFAAGQLIRHDDGSLELIGSGTFNYREFGGEVIGHMELGQVLEASYKWLGHFGPPSDAVKVEIRTYFEKEIAKQFTNKP